MTTVEPAFHVMAVPREHCEVNGPTLDFADLTPYDAYVHTTELHNLQHPLSKDPGEMSFLVISQVMELYFGLTRFELRETQRLLREGDVWGTLAPLKRVALDLDGLNASWQGLHWMSPSDFNRFRAQLGEASGFQSSMYRQMEFLLGLKQASVIRAFHKQADIFRDLTEALEGPSVWDDVTAMLHRRGFDVPDPVPTTADHEPDPRIEAAWVKIYAEDTPDNHLRRLGEALTEVAERFHDWRYKHVSAVQRTMGSKEGSGGSAGLSWLQRSMSRMVFPELWSARTSM